jgi:hypothetical protein
MKDKRSARQKWSVAEIKEILAHGLDVLATREGMEHLKGKRLEVWGHNVGDSVAWDVYMKSTSSEWMSPETLEIFAPMHGFEDGLHFITTVADLDLHHGHVTR